MLVGSIEYAPTHDPFAVLEQAGAALSIQNPPANDNFPLPRVVALTGSAGSGKSTLADYLVDNYQYQRVKFAGPLKAMCRAIGMTDVMIEGSEKELPQDVLCGRSPRYFMQRLGTDFGRDLISEDFWTNLWLRATRQILANGGRVVCDDCRFDNEALCVQSVGGIVVQLRGRSAAIGQHVSEQGVGEPDVVIHNKGSIYDLKRRMDELLHSVGF